VASGFDREPEAVGDPEPSYEDDPSLDDAEDDIAIEAYEDAEAYDTTEEREAAEQTRQDLRQSPVLSASPKPLSRPRQAQMPAGSPVGVALTVLAGQVAALGVPTGQRAATRAALLDLGRELDEGTATRASIRHLAVLSLDHPPLARRVIPLLVPYLELE
jgi:hypothetical protein